MYHLKVKGMNILLFIASFTTMAAMHFASAKEFFRFRGAIDFFEMASRKEEDAALESMTMIVVKWVNFALISHVFVKFVGKLVSQMCAAN